MCNNDDIHQNDIGTLFTITIVDCSIPVNISGANVKNIKFTKPSGILVTKNANFLTDGSDGILTYTTVNGDLDEIGNWKLQAYLELGSNKYNSSIETFRVNRNL
jgi:hypothetical protein